MILKSLGKVSISGGIVSGAVLVDNVAHNAPKDIRSSIEKGEKGEKAIKTVEDIELFEKLNECSFVFVKSWKGEELYGAREFLKEEKKSEDARKKVLEGDHWNKAQGWCKEKKGLVTLFFGGEDQQFALTPPADSW